ncbi:MAG: hypothetical protein ABR985_15105 [Methanotrichaceae archaeon]
MHVERGWISDAGPFKSSLATPEFNAALEVRVEDPLCPHHPKALDWSQPSPKAILLRAKRIRARRRSRANVYFMDKDQKGFCCLPIPKHGKIVYPFKSFY